MGKIRVLCVTAAVLACPLLVGSSNNIGQAIRATAYLSAGVLPESSASVNANANTDFKQISQDDVTETDMPAEETENPPGTVEETAEQSSLPEISEEAASPAAGAVITRNMTEYNDDADLTAAGNNSGAILREHYGISEAADYITLSGGAQVRNCTELDNDTLLRESEELPDFRLVGDSAEPQVLIVHTHTTESYEPYTRDYYDEDFPSRTRDSSRNMVAVGEAMAQALADSGITVLHDCTEHDYPVYTGSYDRSEETIRAALEEYPSIKIVIDLHRDAIENADGSRVAPVADVDGKTAAQFMIIAGCDNGQFNMPDYMQNFRFACLIQNTAEEMYPGLARPVLFDYRNYNQHITTGSLLIEVGSHANSFDEALYTGELLGEILGEAARCLMDNE